MLQKVIDNFKRLRTEQFLRQTFQHQYAFVGMGQHSLTNLYPVLHYLGVPLKYICVTKEDKAQLIARKYPNVTATTQLDDVLRDKDVAAVFIAASPAAHFSLAQQVLKAGKALFIEKPPCLNSNDLEVLNVLGDSKEVLVGLQKRYAPAVRILKNRLEKDWMGSVFSYDLHYVTGAYPEGDSLTDLYIHPLDLAIHLFGPATVVAARRTSDNSYLLMLEHGKKTVGTVELSTSYTWTSASETLKICTKKGIYRLEQLDTLTFESKQASLMGIPLEKVHPTARSVQYLFARNNFTPTPTNNQLYTQGFYDELLSFTNLVEGRRAQNLTRPDSLVDTFKLIEQLRSL